jgi:hypothetical protein
MPRSTFQAVPRALDANGNPVSAAQLFTYKAGTTTPVTVYSDLAQTTAHAFPIVADANGYFAAMYLPAGSYKYVVRTPAGTTLSTADNLTQSPGSFGVPVEVYGAVGDGVTDDRSAFITAEASGASPLLLTGNYYLSSNTSSTSDVYEMDGNATVTMGTGLFQPARYTDNKLKTLSQRVNFSATNPVTTEPSTYQLLDGYVSYLYGINQWGKQNITGGINTARTGVNLQLIELVHSAEGDGYGSFWKIGTLPHSRTASATSWIHTNSGGMANGGNDALGNKVALYALGDLKLRDNGYTDVAMFHYVGFLNRNGADSGDYYVPRVGCLMINQGALPVDAFFVGRGNVKAVLDTTGAAPTYGAIAMKAGQSILFDATAGNSTLGQFSASAAGAYSLSKPAGLDAFVFTRGADDNDLLRVQGSSSTARASIGSAGTVAYFTAHTSASENTVLALRTALGGVITNRLVIDETGTVTMSGASVLVPNMHTHANNAAAVSAGRLVGTLYKTATGEVRIVV